MTSLWDEPADASSVRQSCSSPGGDGRGCNSQLQGDGRTDKRPSLRVLESARLPGQCNQPAVGGAKPLSHTFASKSHRAHCKRLFASKCSPWPGIMHWPFDPKIIIIIMMVLILIMLLWLVRLQPNRNKLFNLSHTEDLSFDLLFFFVLLLHVVRLFLWLPFFFP